MDTKNERKWDSTSGLLSLEASIVLTIFLFLMLFMYSFLVVFEARNEIAHVLLSTADSLALDAFITDNVEEDSVQEFLYELYGVFSDSNGTFTETARWYDTEYNTQRNDEAYSTQLVQDTVQTRFVAYLADGDEKEADRILKGLNIEGGLDSLDFSGSKISNGDLYITVRYKIDYEYKVFNLGSITFEQSCCSRLWK